MTTNPYTDGTQAVTQEALAVLQNADHPKHNPSCEACRIIGRVSQVLLEALSGKMTQNELFGIAMALYDINKPEDEPEPDPPFFDLVKADLRMPACV